MHRVFGATAFDNLSNLKYLREVGLGTRTEWMYFRVWEHILYLSHDENYPGADGRVGTLYQPRVYTSIHFNHFVFYTWTP